ncbi:hypothetical protein [Nocardia tengchongensis]|uniref:hypothetical protein n=1 Tax=Nocardia tengchongensis TaxID=2055889 RepID=UPI0036A10475
MNSQSLFRLAAALWRARAVPPVAVGLYVAGLTVLSLTFLLPRRWCGSVTWRRGWA